MCDKLFLIFIHSKYRIYELVRSHWHERKFSAHPSLPHTVLKTSYEASKKIPNSFQGVSIAFPALCESSLSYYCCCCYYYYYYYYYYNP
jgi:hypothetical protein